MAYIFDASKGETPDSVAQQRKMAEALAARIFGKTPQNMGEGLSAIGQSWIARSMQDEATAAQKAGAASGNDAFSQITGMISGQPMAASSPATPTVAGPPPIPAEAMSGAPMGGQAAPLSGGFMPKPTSPYAGAIASIESGGDYGSLGPITKNGDRAYGKYQVMGANVPQWTREALGQEMTPEQFAASPQAQDAVFNAKFGKYAEKYGPEGAAKAWFAGEGGMNNPNAKDILGTSVAGYANKFNKALGTQVASLDPSSGMGMAQPQPMAAPQSFMPPSSDTQPPTTMAFNGQSQPGNPMSDASSFAPAPQQGFAPSPAGQPNITNVRTRPNAMAGDESALPPKAQPTQAPGRQSASGPTTAQLIKAAENPWLNEGQRAVVNGMLKQKMEAEQKANDPLHQLQIKKAEADLQYGKNPESVREYEYARDNNDFKGSLEEWIARKRGGAGEYGLTPVMGTGPDGKPALIQLGKSGKPIMTPLPDGFSIAREPIKVEGPTGTTILDPQTRQIVSFIPKDVRGAKREEGIGEQQGKEVAAAPGDVRSGENALGIIEKIKKHEYIDRGTGITSYGNAIRGTGGYDFENLVQGAKSGAFLQAIQQMRGLGSLSNAEGDAATRAISRMDTATSKKAFLDAVGDYENIVKQGIGRAQGRLANPSATAPAPVPRGKTSSGVQWSVE